MELMRGRPGGRKGGLEMQSLGGLGLPRGGSEGAAAGDAGSEGFKFLGGLGSVGPL